MKNEHYDNLLYQDDDNYEYLKEDRAVTDNIISDVFGNLEYKPLSRKQETSLIKKAKLSFYDQVDDETKKLFLKYYGEEFPLFKAKYETALDEEKEVILDEAIENSIYYRDKFIKNNQRLVLAIANKFLSKCRTLDLMDLTQEGNIGLMKALERFDLTLGCKFSTYATNWIKREVYRVIAERDSAIKPSSTYSRDVKKISSVESELYNDLYIKPTLEQLAYESGLNLDKVNEVLYYRTYQYILESIEKPIDEDETITIGDKIVNDEEPIPFTIERKLMHENFVKLLENSNLNGIELRIIYMYFGFDDIRYSIEEIVDELNISRSQIYRTKAKALQKLKNQKYAKLSSYKDDYRH